MYNRQSKYNIGIILVIIALIGALLFGLWGLFLKDRAKDIEPDENQINEPIEERKVLDIKDYKVYKYDNVDYRFILAQVESTDQINLRDIQTSENFTLDQSSNLVSSLITKGYHFEDVLDKLNEDSSGFLFIPIYDNLLTEIELLSETVDINHSTFNLSNPIEDKSLLGFIEDEPVEEDQVENEEPVIVDQEDPIINPETPPLALQEIDSSSVYIQLDGEVVQVGFPSNIRIFTLEVSRPEGSSPITAASLTFLNDDLTFEAKEEPYLILSSSQANIVNRVDLTRGLLFFEINSANYNITNLEYSVELIGGH